MRRGVRWGLLAGGLAMAVSVRAGAADDPVTREAQARFEEGLGRLKAEKYEDARLSFAQAYAVVRRPSILWNLALAEEKSGHPLDALGHFKDYVRQSTADDDRVRAQKHVDALAAQTGHIDVEAFGGTPLTVDGAAVGLTPLGEPVDVMPGKHHVEARSALTAKSADVDVAAGQIAHVSFMTVDPPPPPPPPAPPAEPAPQAAAAQPPAEVPGEAPPRDASEPRSPFWTPKVVTVTALGGAAVVAGGLGVYLAVQSRRNASTADGFRASNPSGACLVPTTSSSVCQQWNDAVDAQNRDALLSGVFYVSGVVLAAGAVATWFFWPKASSGPTARVVPMIGPGQAGLGAVGRF